jgi:beta-aspartyl-dipeptidase (metallo-type)
MSMFKLIKGAKVFSPDYVGQQDILIVGEKIVRVASGMDVPSEFGDVEVIEATGKIVTPGFIDHHTHFLGGGGTAGYASRPPALPLSHFTRIGVTTAVGCLGADGTTRRLESLLAVARALEEEGLTTYVFSGCTTEHPAITLTGRVRTDIIFIDKVIGAGEISLSELGPSIDSLGPGIQYVARVAAEAFFAGRIASKAGVVCLQVPTGGRGMAPLLDLLEVTQIPITQFIPSHVNSHPAYLDQAMEFAKRGGVADVGSSHTQANGFAAAIEPSLAIRKLLDAGVPIENITLSSDGNGVSGWNYLAVDTLLTALRETVLQQGVDLSQALKVVTSNVARVLRLTARKGHVQAGLDADLVVMDQDLEIHQVYARGRRMVDEGVPIVRGAWEETFWK